MAKLSPAERAVAEGIADGLRLGEIAERRGTVESTVKNQANSARRKLGARSLAQLAVMIATTRNVEEPEERAS